MYTHIHSSVIHVHPYTLEGYSCTMWLISKCYVLFVIQWYCGSCVGTGNVSQSVNVLYSIHLYMYPVFVRYHLKHTHSFTYIHHYHCL